MQSPDKQSCLPGKGSVQLASAECSRFPPPLTGIKGSGLPGLFEQESFEISSAQTRGFQNFIQRKWVDTFTLKV